MMRLRTLAAVGTLCLAVGCDASPGVKKVEEKAKSGASAVKEATKEGVSRVKEATKEGVEEVKKAAEVVEEKARVAVIQPIQDYLPKLQEKISGLSGDAKTKAAEKLEQLKKLLEEAKTAAPEKWESLKASLAETFAELKKMVGLDK